jgi:hypothetical protein
VYPTTPSLTRRLSGMKPARASTGMANLMLKTVLSCITVWTRSADACAVGEVGLRQSALVALGA